MDLIYGQVKKSYRQRKLVQVTPVMRLGTHAALKVALQVLGLSGRLNTAFIERVNLTVRHGVAALARRTWATSQQASQLVAHLQWWRAYYHFVRPHESLRVALVQPRERGSKLVRQRYQQRTEALVSEQMSRVASTAFITDSSLDRLPYLHRPVIACRGNTLLIG